MSQLLNTTITGTLEVSGAVTFGGATPEVRSAKDATGGYAGLTGFQIDLMDPTGAIKSFIASAATAARTYTFKDRTGTIADMTDIAACEQTANKDASGGYAGLTVKKINFGSSAAAVTSFLMNAATAARNYTFQDRDGTIADNTDITSAKARANHTGTQTLSTISDAGTAAAAALDIDGTLAANSNSRVASQAAVVTYVAAAKAAVVATSLQTANNLSELTGSAATVRTNIGLGNVTNDAQLKASQLDTDGTLSANSNTRVASQAAVVTYVTNAIIGLMKVRGGTACAGNPNYPAAVVGDAYYVTSAGKIGGASGTPVDIGDVFVCQTANAGGTQASVGADWFILEHNLQGALLAANNLSELTGSAATVRTNIGLGNVANVDTTNAANISTGTLPAARLPAPAATTFGGLKSSTGTASQWVRYIDTTGTQQLSQPAITDISGAGTAAGAALDTDTSMTANSNSRVPSQAAVVAYVAAHSGGGGGGSAPFTLTASGILLYSDDSINNRRVYLDGQYNPVIASGVSESGGSYSFDASLNTPIIQGYSGNYGRIIFDASFNPGMASYSSGSPVGSIAFDPSGVPLIVGSLEFSTQKYFGFNFDSNPMMAGSSNSGTYLGFDSSQMPAIYFSGAVVLGGVSGNSYEYSLWNQSGYPVVGADYAGHGYIQDASESGNIIGFSSGLPYVQHKTEGGNFTVQAQSGTLAMILKNLPVNSAPGTSGSLFIITSGYGGTVDSFLAGGGQLLAISP